jgi:hypothetical protein
VPYLGDLHAAESSHSLGLALPYFPAIPGIASCVAADAALQGRQAKLLPAVAAAHEQRTVLCNERRVAGAAPAPGPDCNHPLTNPNFTWNVDGVACEGGSGGRQGRRRAQLPESVALRGKRPCESAAVASQADAVGVRAAALRVRERIARAHCCTGRKDGAGRWRLKSGGRGARATLAGASGEGGRPLTFVQNSGTKLGQTKHPKPSGCFGGSPFKKREH